MESDNDKTSFTHSVKGNGAAKGMSISGTRRLLGKTRAASAVPLVVAIHGGTYTHRYFDIPGHSLIDQAGRLGIPIIALDRPGYGKSSPLPPAKADILTNAEVLDEVVGELWQEHGAHTAGVFVIGHSIGGAVVTAMAAKGPSWPLLGIAVSGCLLQVPPESKAAWAGLPDIPFIDLPVPLKDGVMFGPDWTYDSGMPAASHPSNTTCPRAELIDITSTWIDRVKATAAKVKVPVHARQGEFDKLWITDAAQMDGFRAAFTGSPRVDARLVPTAGHCIDFHRAGAGFQLEQLGFGLQCCIKTPA